MRILTLVVSDFQQNCRILWDENDLTAIIVDPGGNLQEIEAVLSREKLTLAEIWLTHSHLDHCGAVAPLLQRTGALLRAHPEEKCIREYVPETAELYGLASRDYHRCPEPQKPLVGGELLSGGGSQWEVRFTPGHSPGHVVFYSQQEGILLAGDTLFAGSIGRTDLPGGEYATLIKSISEQIMTLPDYTRVLSGHGPDTTIGDERKHNPFLVEGGLYE